MQCYTRVLMNKRHEDLLDLTTLFAGHCLLTIHGQAWLLMCGRCRGNKCDRSTAHYVFGSWYPCFSSLGIAEIDNIFYLCGRSQQAAFEARIAAHFWGVLQESHPQPDKRVESTRAHAWIRSNRWHTRLRGCHQWSFGGHLPTETLLRNCAG